MNKTSLTKEQNCQRKAHRMRIPIHAIIDHVTYAVTDWSTQGLNIVTTAAQPTIDIAIGDIVSMTLMLPTGESSILLRTEAMVKKIEGSHYGLEIIHISDKNRRVLRHYATLAIEGNRDSVDALTGDLFMSDVPSPLQEPITLTEKEHKEVHESFQKRSFFYMLMGLLLAVVVVTTLIYNYLVIFESTGLIAGNAKHYSAPQDGVIKAVYVTNAESVMPGQLLFEMEGKGLQESLKGLRAQDKLMRVQLASTRDDLEVSKGDSLKKTQEITQISKQERESLQASYGVEKEAYDRATRLYEKQLITLQTYTDVQNQYFAFKSRYDDVVLHDNSANKNRLLADQALSKNKDHMLSLQKSINTLEVEIEANAMEMATLEQQLRDLSVIAQERGVVHNIFHKGGDHVEFSDSVVTLEVDQQPFVLTKMFTDEVASVHIGGPCLLYSEREHRSYRGHIEGIGYSVTEGSTTNTTEISQNEIPIRIVFEDPSLRFHLNEYLEVFMINDSSVAKALTHIMPQSLLTL